MFNEIVLDALHSRDAKLAKLKDSNYEKIVAEAISRWVVFDPKGQECRSAGVDSSWNKRALQGLDLYVIAAVAVTSSNEILAKEWDNDVSGSARGDQLEGKAMEMEMSVAQKARNSSKTDIVCVDGSIISQTSINFDNCQVAKRRLDWSAIAGFTTARMAVVIDITSSGSEKTELRPTFRGLGNKDRISILFYCFRNFCRRTS